MNSWYFGADRKSTTWSDINPEDENEDILKKIIWTGQFDMENDDHLIILFSALYDVQVYQLEHFRAKYELTSKTKSGSKKAASLASVYNFMKTEKNDELVSKAEEYPEAVVRDIATFMINNVEQLNLLILSLQDNKLYDFATKHYRHLEGFAALEKLAKDEKLEKPQFMKLKPEFFPTYEFARKEISNQITYYEQGNNPRGEALKEKQAALKELRALRDSLQGSSFGYAFGAAPSMYYY